MICFGLKTGVCDALRSIDHMPLFSRLYFCNNNNKKEKKKKESVHISPLRRRLHRSRGVRLVKST